MGCLKKHQSQEKRQKNAQLEAINATTPAMSEDGTASAYRTRKTTPRSKRPKKLSDNLRGNIRQNLSCFRQNRTL